MSALQPDAMAYTLNIDNPALVLFRTLPRAHQHALIEKAQVLKEKPMTGEPLKGKYRLLRSLTCDIDSESYRIIYQIFHAGETIIIRLTDRREHMYHSLDQVSH